MKERRHLTGHGIDISVSLHQIRIQLERSIDCDPTCKIRSLFSTMNDSCVLIPNLRSLFPKTYLTKFMCPQHDYINRVQHK